MFCVSFSNLRHGICCCINTEASISIHISARSTAMFHAPLLYLSTCPSKGVCTALHYMNHKALISTCDERSEDEAVCEMQAATSLDSHDLGIRTQVPSNQNCHITPMNSLIHRKGPSVKLVPSFMWLEYSQQNNSAFCFACRVFGRNLKHDVFVHDVTKLEKSFECIS